MLKNRPFSSVLGPDAIVLQEIFFVLFDSKACMCCQVKGRECVCYQAAMEIS